MESTLVKVSGCDKYINIRTVTRRSSHSMAIGRWDLLHLQSRQELIVRDGDSFAVLWKMAETDVLRITFSWLAACGDRLRGEKQRIELPYQVVMAYVKAEPGGQELRFLSSMENDSPPRLVFRGKRLREVAGNKLARRKLSRFLREHFRWPGATEIVLYDDLVPYSFFFQEMCGESKGICGGVILHGQDDMRTAMYAIHT